MGLADWKKRFLNMDMGVSKITVAEDSSQNCIQKKTSLKNTTSLDDRLVRILHVKTLGSEVAETLKPKMQLFEKMSPLDYQSHLDAILKRLKALEEKEKRPPIQQLYKDAIRVLQAETISADLLEEFRIMLLQG